jgi:hypothetical protein
LPFALWRFSFGHLLQYIQELTEGGVVFPVITNICGISEVKKIKADELIPPAS